MTAEAPVSFNILGADVSRERPRNFAVAVLPSARDEIRGNLDRARNQGRRQTYQNVRKCWLFLDCIGNCPDLAEMQFEPVHLPISGD